jgi:hypothetical protein
MDMLPLMHELLGLSIRIGDVGFVDSWCFWPFERFSGIGIARTGRVSRGFWIGIMSDYENDIVYPNVSEWIHFRNYPKHLFWSVQPALLESRRWPCS